MQAALTTDTSGPALDWPGGVGTFLALYASGTGTLKLQYLPAGLAPATAGNWIDVPSASFTTSGLVNFSLPRGKLRANLASSGGGPSVTYDMARVAIGAG